jgi:hypothetical protein
MANDQKTTQVVRLSAEVYTELERKFNLVRPDNSTTVIQVGYNLGVQAVLKELRTGFVVSQ